MRIPFGPRDRGDMQDTLRSVGAVLDIVGARSVLIREVGDGLMVRGRISPTLTDRIEGVTCPIERSLSRRDLAGLRAEAIARRGTGHVAGPVERSLRVIGRHIDERRLRGVTLIENASEPGWLLWHERMPSARPVLFLFVEDELRLADDQAAEARLRKEGNWMTDAAGALVDADLDAEAGVALEHLDGYLAVTGQPLAR